MSLDRFLHAQSEEQAYQRALQEIRQGKKQTHWMWFVFPQLRGLGSSPVSQHFGLDGMQETQDYLQHPILGPRLIGCCEALAGLPDPDPERIFGSVDALKLRSCLTLFSLAETDGGASIFGQLLERWYGEPDSLTVKLLNR